MSVETGGGVLGKIIELSKIDVVIAGLEAQKKKFESDMAAKAAEIKGFEGVRASKLGVLDAKRALVAREEKGIKGERERINERRRALSGQTDYKVQQAMEREIEFVSKQIGQREEVLLGVMREVEVLEADTSNLESAINKSKEELSALTELAQGEIAAINERLTDYNAQRTSIVTDVGPTHVGLVAYNRIKNRYPQDPIVVILNRSSCGGCHMSIGPQLIVQASRGEVVKCAGCSRILRLDDEQAAA
jgi:predicted  nucleic acid-binding Zn-ribbon protein